MFFTTMSVNWQLCHCKHHWVCCAFCRPCLLLECVDFQQNSRNEILWIWKTERRAIGVVQSFEATSVRCLRNVTTTADNQKYGRRNAGWQKRQTVFQAFALTKSTNFLHLQPFFTSSGKFQVLVNFLLFCKVQIEFESCRAVKRTYWLQHSDDVQPVAVNRQWRWLTCVSVTLKLPVEGLPLTTKSFQTPPRRAGGDNRGVGDTSFDLCPREGDRPTHRLYPVWGSSLFETHLLSSPTGFIRGTYETRVHNRKRPGNQHPHFYVLGELIWFQLHSRKKKERVSEQMKCCV